jgi:hypothetical protein
VNQPKSTVSISREQGQFLATNLENSRDLSFNTHTNIGNQSPIKGLTSPTKQNQSLGYPRDPEPSIRIVDGSFGSGSDPYQSDFQHPASDPLPAPNRQPPAENPRNPKDQHNQSMGPGPPHHQPHQSRSNLSAKSLHQDSTNTPQKPPKKPKEKFRKDPHWGNLTGQKSSSEEYTGSSSGTDRTSTKSLMSGGEVRRQKGQFRKKNIPNMDGMGMNPMMDPRMAQNPFVGNGMGMMGPGGYMQNPYGQSGM